jgi:hypothetical protein
VVSHIVQENRRIQFTDSINDSAVPIALSVSSSTDFTGAREAEDVCDAASRIAAIHQQEVALSHAGREYPVSTVLFVKPMVLTLDCALDPHFEGDAKIFLEFNYMDAFGSAMPIVMRCNRTASDRGDGA